MSRTAVARTYADTLLELASREGAEETWLEMMSEVTGLYESSPPFKAFLHTPRVSDEDKRRVLLETFRGRYPEMFIRFLLIVLDKRRQGLLPDIETACRDLLYERTGRVHASVTVATEIDPEFRTEIGDKLSAVLGREVDADFRVDPRLIGGMVVQVEDKVLDGSVRRRLQLLRRNLLEHGV